MQKFSKWVINKKYIIIIIVIFITFLSAFFINKVAINYNNSDYLPKDTETAIGIDIMKTEFGLSGSIQVMISDIDEAKSLSLLKEFESLDNIVSVSFDSKSTDYYVNQNALYIFMIDSGDYSTNTLNAINDIKAIVNIHNYEATYAGSAIQKIALMDAMTSELPYILIICVVLAAIILILTASSWIEPFLFLFVSGIGIIINLGTNIIFGEISYITTSVAAILQLALSMDYGIVLMHRYHEKQKHTKDNKLAMQQALTSTISPVSASALTTIAGLLALLFMSFRIGFDIGIVLSKGIVISAILAFTLLPGIIIIFDRLMFKTKKNPIALKSISLSKIAVKRNVLIITIALIAIVTGGILKAFNSYSFMDSKIDVTKMVENFSYNNALVVLYPNENESTSIENQQEFINSLSDYTIDDKQVLSSYTAYINTVKAPLTIQNVSQMLNVDQNSVSDLFALYHLYESENLYKLDFKEFIFFLNDLIDNDETVSNYIDNDTSNLIKILFVVYNLAENENTYSELTQQLNNDVLTEFSGIDTFSIQQAYGLYDYDNGLVSNPDVSFKTILDFMIDSFNNNPNISDMVDSATLDSLTTLATSIDQLLMPVTKSEFQAIMLANYGTNISDIVIDVIYDFYFTENNLEVVDTIPLINLLNLLNEQGFITDPSDSALITNYYQTCVDYVNQDYAYEDFLPALGNVVLGLTGSVASSDISNDAIQQIYILYFYENDILPDTKIKGNDFIHYLLNKSETNDFVNAGMSNEIKLMLNDVLSIDIALSDPIDYSYTELTEKISALQADINSVSMNDVLSAGMVSGVYAKYIVANDLDYQDSILADDLLNFIVTNMNSNEVLSQSLSDEQKAKIVESQTMLTEANELLTGENYSRIIINVNLPTDSNESYEFANYVSQLTKQIFGDSSYVAGEIMSTKDLRDSFRHDVTLISIMSALAILIIIMIIYRSISLPVLLVLVIQGSIWISMSFAFVTGNSLFFMSYIIATCILMGATIDYGILISSRYIESRLEFDRKTSIQKALEGALPSIFTSGSILVICGFTVFFVSSQKAISTVGILLGVGTSTSLLMVLFALPSFLYIFDKFIMNTTYKTKDISKNQKK